MAATLELPSTPIARKITFIRHENGKVTFKSNQDSFGGSRKVALNAEFKDIARALKQEDIALTCR